ncbi:hypothetical protein CCM_07498 [Cordyceps militaris CM01]|uniref:Gfd2/YDR514C-like C-terminal domain-containing protein n=1 Tax=Cordyceps militaris (strain CM01) TaxID=983644 RepID=G3JPZ5_CORMM|nr:uncharacterized protein CCM_07498 [Cordyceps militaris CM01]EGX89246.1 hypothetical protein CCM_07498 [Cordyceps militaris CM01]
MRYSQNPGTLKTKHWSTLWRSNISDLGTIQTSQVGFVAIDAEPWGPKSLDVAEVGLSLIFPFDLSKVNQPPKTMEELRGHLEIETYSIKICGREQGKRERFLEQNSKMVQPKDLENTLVEVLMSFRAKLAAIPKAKGSLTAPPLVLVGFDLSFELRSLSASYPKIADCFTSWVDLQELVKEAAQLDKAPSLRDSLTALGFGSVSTDVGSVWKKHSAGKDTVRIAAVLASLSLRGAEQEVLPMTFTWRRKWSPAKQHMQYRGTGKLFKNGPPQPTELFPFTAKLTLCGGRPSSLSGKVEASDIMKLFAGHNPTAVGSCCHDGSITAFVTMPSFDALEQFVANMDGALCEVYGGAWNVESIFDPTVTHARTAEELEEFNKENLQATIAAKKEQRRQKRLEQGLESALL